MAVLRRYVDKVQRDRRRKFAVIYACGGLSLWGILSMAGYAPFGAQPDGLVADPTRRLGDVASLVDPQLQLPAMDRQLTEMVPLQRHLAENATSVALEDGEK